MAQADHLPSPIHDSFPDASATKATSRGRPAAHENNEEPSDTATVRTSSQTLRETGPSQALYRRLRCPDHYG